ncbi:MAG TPA: thiamine-phosphate kinase [Pseudomonadales bacterium]|nr:thiamine-phosphate kinase [Pseudomonadales bacterium]
MAGREFDIIERYFSGLIPGDSEGIVQGPGDDCAILDIPDDRHLCVSTDTLIAGVHFPELTPAAAVAHRTLAANLSDLAAMGAKCFAFTLALTLPNEDERWLQEFSSSLSDLVSRFHIPLIGGNLARGALSITVTVLGTLPRGKGLKRSGANADDDIYVSGSLGDAGGALQLIGKGGIAPQALADRFYYPEPRLRLGEALLDLASAAVDISDGLAADLGHVCRASGVGASIEIDAIPLSAALVGQFDNDRALELAVSSGDDYELCFTAPRSSRQEIERIAGTTATRVTRIGRVVAGSGVGFVDSAGKPRQFEIAGYEHFHET